MFAHSFYHWTPFLVELFAWNDLYVLRIIQLLYTSASKLSDYNVASYLLLSLLWYNVGNCGWEFHQTKV